MEKIYYRSKDCPKGTPFKLGFALYPGGDWIDIANYNGSPWRTRYRLSELEIQKWHSS
uniref:Uncharacterized protein n=1 Tax=viral metagenome TaxID=1070528 RepID=A0A6H1Z8C4_9ZZZZ